MLALIAYPFTAWFGARHDQWLPALLALGLLLTGIALGRRGRSRLLAAALAIVVLGAGLTDASAAGAALVKLQPVLINLGLSYLFGHTLFGGHTPLITRIILLERGELDAATRRYGRNLTRFWALFTAALALEALLLALFASEALWAQLTGALNYALVALLFVAEYPLRVRLLDHLEHHGFWHFIGTLPKYSPRAILRDPQ
jgi:uncharacterized membrane protein